MSMFEIMRDRYQSARVRLEANSIPVPESGCWLWLGSLQSGYGALMAGDKSLAHRISYQEYVGAIPEGMCVCHKCDTPSCVNPDHLFLGTHKDNTADKMAKGRHKAPARKAECAHGHKMTSENTYAFRDRRHCKRCNARRSAEYKLRKGVAK